MSFLAGFLAAWSDYDDKQARREEFNREMTMKATAMVYPQVFEEMTAINQKKAKKAQKIAYLSQAGFSPKAIAVLESTGELDKTIVRVEEAGTDLKKGWVSGFNDVIETRAKDDPGFAAGLDALLESVERDGADAPAEITWARVQAAMFAAENPEEVFAMGADLSRQLADTEAALSRIPTARLPEDTPTPNYYTATPMDEASYENIVQAIDAQLEAVEGSAFENNVYSGPDKAGYNAYKEATIAEAMRIAEESGGDVVGAIRDVTGRMADLRSNVPADTAATYGNLAKAFTGGWDTTQAAVEVETAPSATAPVTTARAAEPETDAVNSLAGDVAATGAADESGLSFNPDEYEDPIINNNFLN